MSYLELKALDRSIADAYREYERNVLREEMELDGIDALIAACEEENDA